MTDPDLSNLPYKALDAIKNAPQKRLLPWQREFAAWVQHRYETRDVLVKLPTGGIVPGPCKVNLEREANGLRGYADKLPAWKIKAHLDGKLSLHASTKRRIDDDKIVIRVEADAHNGETDALPAVQDASGKVIGTWFIQPTPRGAQAYSTVEIPSTTSDGYTYRISNTDLSGDRFSADPAKKAGIIKRLGEALGAAAKQKGFKATIEAQGGPNVWSGKATPREQWPKDGPVPITRRLIKSAQKARIPRPMNEEEWHTLRDAKVSWDAVVNLVTSHNLLRNLEADRIVPTARPTAKIASLKPSAPATATPRFTASGDKWADSLRAANKAIKEAFGPASKWPRPIDVSDEIIARLIDRSNDVYTASGAATGQRDGDRDRRLRDAVVWALNHPPRKIKSDEAQTNPGLPPRTPGPTPTAPAGGGETPWFDIAVDLPVAQTIIGRLLSRRAFRKIARENEKRCQRRITAKHLGITYLTLSKDAVMKNGRVPTKAVHRMLRFHGLSSNGSIVALCIKILTQIGLVRLVKEAFRDLITKTGKCRVWAIASAAFTMPFLRKFAPTSDEARQPANAGASGGAGRGQHEASPTVASSTLASTVVYEVQTSTDPSLHSPPLCRKFMNFVSSLVDFEGFWGFVEDPTA